MRGTDRVVADDVSAQALGFGSMLFDPVLRLIGIFGIIDQIIALELHRAAAPFENQLAVAADRRAAAEVEIARERGGFTRKRRKQVHTVVGTRRLPGTDQRGDRGGHVDERRKLFRADAFREPPFPAEDGRNA